MNNLIKRMLFTTLAITLPVVAFTANAQATSWLSTYSKEGNCKILFPSVPEHMQQLMPVPEQNTHLQYDVYVSGFEGEAVFMMLIAEYPVQGMDGYAEMNLENFLNGILSQNPNNKLIFADISEINGHKALDFFIRTKGVFFKGRAIMANNHLYLIAMECEMQHYNEDRYNYFVNSFEFLK
ncbi:MAG: hypothetical protein HY860_06590 [Chlamydiales bacterium]|nr:hypothetical protein [Chlamydiales bacterium]